MDAKQEMTESIDQYSTNTLTSARIQTSLSPENFNFRAATDFTSVQLEW